ncbi:MAG: glycosyltransferase family 4 protein [Caldilineaceae bacterium]
MNILLLAHFYPPEMGGAASRMHGLARWLVQYGHQVTVVTAFPNYPSGVVPEQYRGKLWQRESMDGVDILRTWIYASPKRGSMRRLANYFSFVASSALTGAFAKRRFDVVLASSPPLFIGMAGFFLAKRYGAKFVFDIRDIWPELAVEAGEYTADAAMVRWGERLERFLYQQADHITVVTEAKRAKLLAKHVPSNKLSVVANGVDLDLLTRNDSTDWRGRFGLNGHFTAVYAGLIGIFQGTEVIADAASELRQSDDIHFLIVGDGVKKPELEKRIAEQKLNNVTLAPQQPREAIPGILKSANVAIVPLVNENLVDAVPSKLLEAWGCHLPVILVAGGEARRLVEESGGGVVIPPGSPDKLAQAVVEMAASRQNAQKFAEQGFAYVANNFDRRTLARQMESVLHQVVGKNYRQSN